MLGRVLNRNSVGNNSLDSFTHKTERPWINTQMSHAAIVGHTTSDSTIDIPEEAKIGEMDHPLEDLVRPYAHSTLRIPLQFS